MLKLGGVRRFGDSVVAEKIARSRRQLRLNVGLVLAAGCHQPSHAAERRTAAGQCRSTVRMSTQRGRWQASLERQRMQVYAIATVQTALRSLPVHCPYVADGLLKCEYSLNPFKYRRRVGDGRRTSSLPSTVALFNCGSNCSCAHLAASSTTGSWLPTFRTYSIRRSVSKQALILLSSSMPLDESGCRLYRVQPNVTQTSDSACSGASPPV
jgi:hypothetical protein